MLAKVRYTPSACSRHRPHPTQMYVQHHTYADTRRTWSPYFLSSHSRGRSRPAVILANVGISDIDFDCLKVGGVSDRSGDLASYGAYDKFKSGRITNPLDLSRRLKKLTRSESRRVSANRQGDIQDVTDRDTSMPLP